MTRACHALSLLLDLTGMLASCACAAQPLHTLLPTLLCAQQLAWHALPLAPPCPAERLARSSSQARQRAAGVRLLIR